MTFTSAPNVRPFTFEAVKFKPTSRKNGPANVWPFRGPQPSWPQAAFPGALKTPVLLRSIYKYTVSVTGATPADPLIVVER